MARTYIPTFIRVLKWLCVYTTRYDATIRQYLPPNALPAYEEFHMACNALLEEVTLPSNP